VQYWDDFAFSFDFPFRGWYYKRVDCPYGSAWVVFYVVPSQG